MKQHDFNISSEQKEINDVELYGIIVYFLQMVGEDIECSLQSDTVLIESLLEHIRTLKNWEDYDFEMPLSDELPIPKEILEKQLKKQYYFREIFRISINKRDERINHDSYMRGFCSKS